MSSAIKNSTVTVAHDFFNTAEYIDYLHNHCGVGQDQAIERVAGLDLILRIFKELDMLPGQKVLEIGCGVGRILNILQQHFSVSPFGSDVCIDAIMNIKKNFPELREKVFVAKNFLDFAQNRHFNHVITWGVFELTQQRNTLLEMSRILKIGGRALLCSVKNINYPSDDQDSVAAHNAYIQKSIPINFTDVAQLEDLIAYLGMKIVKRFIFKYKADVINSNFNTDTGGADFPFAEAMYILEKVESSPADSMVYIAPASHPPDKL